MRRADARCGHHAGAARRHDVRTSGRSKPHLAAAQTANRKMNVFVGGKQSEASEHVDNPANANIPKEVFRGLRSALSGLVNFRCCHRLRKGNSGSSTITRRTREMKSTPRTL